MRVGIDPLEGDGRAVIYPGGWTDYRAQRLPDDAPAAKPAAATPARPAAAAAPEPARPQKSGLSFTEKHRLEALPALIERLEAEIAKLTAGSNGALDEADYKRTVAALMSGGSDPVITKAPEGAWTHAITDLALQ